MQINGLLCKEEVIFGQVCECWHLLWVKAHIKCSEAKWKIVLWSNESQCEILFEKHGHCIPQPTDQRDRPASYQHSELRFTAALVPAELVACTCGKTPSVLKGISRFMGSNIWSHVVFFGEAILYFIINRTLNLFQQHHVSEESRTKKSVLLSSETFAGCC